jgi:uncharacterized small protein (TIGR04563 family)
MSGSDKIEKALFLSTAMVDELQSELRRVDRSMSWLAQRAWVFARERIIAATDRKAGTDFNMTEGGPPRKQSLFFPGTMLEEIEAQATRLDCSESALVQLAWHLAKPEIAAIPAADQD